MAIKVDPERSRLNWHTSLLYSLNGAVYSSLLQIQHASHADKLNSVIPAPPIFLLGFWRSGTTLLHELFGCDRRFGFPSTYACLNPHHFLLTESWATERSSRRQARRPMDEMLYSWASPQEDEFALLALGAPSPYESLIVPSLMRDARALLDLRCGPVEKQNRWEQALRYFLRLLTVQQGKTMVLKSPTHGFKLPLLPLLFPEARYVIIERNPYEVFASNLKLWLTLLELYSLESPSLEEVESFILMAYIIHEEAIAEGASHLDPRVFVRVRYDHLVSDPVGQMERVYSELGIAGFEQVQPRLADYAISVAGHRRNRLVISAVQKTRIDAMWGTLIKEKSYTFPANHVALGDKLTFEQPKYASARSFVLAQS